MYTKKDIVMSALVAAALAAGSCLVENYFDKKLSEETEKIMKDADNMNKEWLDHIEKRFSEIKF